MINAFKKFFCKHTKLEIAFALEEVKSSYNVKCPECQEDITILTVGYKFNRQSIEKRQRGCAKKLYLTRKDAETVRNWQLREGHADYLRIYNCHICQGWHLTNAPLRK